MKWDATKHNELVTHRGRLQEEMREISVQLNDEYESDEWAGDAGPGKLQRYMAGQQKHGQLHREIQAVSAEIERMEALRPRTAAELRNPLATLNRRWAMRGGDGLDEGERQHFLVQGSVDELRMQGIVLPFAPGREVELFCPFGRPQLAADDPTRSDLNTHATDSVLGLSVPEEWSPTVTQTLRYYGNVTAAVYVFTTAHGRPIHFNQMDGSGEEGEAIGPGQSQGAGDVPGTAQPLPSTKDVEFGASWRGSKFMPVRFEPETDVHFDVAALVMEQGARRLGRGWNKEFTVGSTANRPKGIVNEAMVIDGGSASADDGTGGLAFTHLLQIEYAIDRAYRIGNEGGDGGFMDGWAGMLGFMFNENIERQLRAMTHPTTKLPVWVPDLEVGQAAQWIPGRIFGRYPYVINQHMADGKGNNHLAVLFGNFNHYFVRRVGSPMYMRFWDRSTMKEMSTDFYAISRCDGRSVGPFDSNSKCEAMAVLQVKS